MLLLSRERGGWFMKESEKILVLIDEIKQGMSVLAKNEEFFQRFHELEYRQLGRTQVTAIVIADAMCTYYTGIETIFLRISQFFENSLNSEKWHHDLLHKMTLRIEGIRPAVISRQTYIELSELLRFRHFKRYYYEFEYDWDRLDLIMKKYSNVKPILKNDMDLFLATLQEMLGRL